MARKSKKELAAEESFEQPTAEENTVPAEEAAPEEAVPASEETAHEEAFSEGAASKETGSEAPAEDAPPAEDRKRGSVMKPVNFRTGPSFLNAVITELKPGTTLTIEEIVEGDKGSWYRCAYDGVTGYVKASGVLILSS